MATETGPRFVFEEDEVFTAKNYLRCLTNNQNPLDHTDFPEDSPFSDQTLSEALNLATEVLEGYLANKGFNKVAPDRKREFQISNADRTRITVSGGPVGITTVARRILEVLPYDMKGLPYTGISRWLMNIGALQWTEHEGRRQRVPTEQGESLGISLETKSRPDGSKYQKTVFSERAQEFILDNLENIAEFISRQDPKEEGAK